jgi:hypothetical protein
MPKEIHKSSPTRFFAVAAVCISLSFVSTGASNAPSPKRPLFDSAEKIVLTLEAPLNSLFNEFRETGEEVEGHVIVHNTNGTTDVVPMKIRTRGKSRRNPEVCSFPPLRVNFAKESTNGTVFEGQDKLKLVTHCQSRKSRYDLYYLQEQTVYQTYNLLTDRSFLTRLAKIDYVDTQGKESVSGKHGFFIEDIDHVSERVGLDRMEIERLEIADLDPFAAARFSLFQYFIGNLDWAFLGGPPGDDCCHNAKLLASAAGSAIHIPYDFDHAGVVDTDYASVPDGISLSSTRQRLYRGLCAYNQQIPGAIDLFNEKRADIYEIVNTNEDLSKSRRDRTVAFYDKFYKTINNPKSLDKSIYSKCRG